MRIHDGRSRSLEKESDSAIGTGIGMEIIAGRRLSSRPDLNASRKSPDC
jgi:hypothetical protein